MENAALQGTAQNVSQPLADAAQVEVTPYYAAQKAAHVLDGATSAAADGQEERAYVHIAVAAAWRELAQTLSGKSMIMPPLKDDEDGRGR